MCRMPLASLYGAECSYTHANTTSSQALPRARSCPGVGAYPDCGACSLRGFRNQQDSRTPDVELHAYTRLSVFDSCWLLGCAARVHGSCAVLADRRFGWGFRRRNELGATPSLRAVAPAGCGKALPRSHDLMGQGCTGTSRRHALITGRVCLRAKRHACAADGALRREVATECEQ